MEGTELVAFNIIASVGTARSCYIDAIDLAAQGDYEAARAQIKEGEQAFTGGHSAHQELLVKMANGEKVEMTLLLTHAEDQLMSAEAFGILADKFIKLYERLEDK